VGGWGGGGVAEGLELLVTRCVAGLVASIIFKLVTVPLRASCGGSASLLFGALLGCIGGKYRKS
jgi:hypothetical protein